MCSFLMHLGGLVRLIFNSIFGHYLCNWTSVIPQAIPKCHLNSFFSLSPSMCSCIPASSKYIWSILHMLDIGESKYGPYPISCNSTGRNKQIVNNKSQIEIDVVNEITGIEKVYLVYSRKVFLKRWRWAETSLLESLVGSEGRGMCKSLDLGKNLEYSRDWNKVKLNKDLSHRCVHYLGGNTTRKYGKHSPFGDSERS